jgi:hypothetical protein
MNNQMEMMILFLILIWGESVQINGKSLIDIGDQQSVNKMYYHESATFIDDQLSVNILVKKSNGLALNYFQKYLIEIHRITVRDTKNTFNLVFNDITYPYSICFDSKFISKENASLYELFSYFFLIEKQLISSSIDTTSTWINEIMFFVI